MADALAAHDSTPRCMTGRPPEALNEDDAGRWYLTAASKGLARRPGREYLVDVQYADGRDSRSFHVGGGFVVERTVAILELAPPLPSRRSVLEAGVLAARGLVTRHWATARQRRTPPRCPPGRAGARGRPECRVLGTPARAPSIPPA